MSCKALKLKGCEIKGSTFQGRKFTFPNRDISSDVFTLKIPKLNIEKQGVVNQNEVYFSYSDFEGFKEGLYAIEFWADFEGIVNELIAEETFVISLTSCGGGSSSKNTTFNLEFPEETIDYSVEYAVINIYDTGGTVTWENVTGKPTVFYDDTEIKEEISEKVDKVEGFGLSENDFSDAYKTKLDGLENYDDAELLAEIEKRVLKQDGYGLSQNNFTTGEKNKLAGLDGNKFFGKFADETALSSIVGIIGAYAYVGGVGRNDESYIWDDDDLKWVKSNNIPTAETPASVKLKYESNPDTNAFTNARRDKLNNAVVASDLPTANVGSATKLHTARTLTLGNTGKSFDGSENITWTLAEIGAQSVWVQNKLSANLTLSANNTRQTIIATANRTVTVASLPDDFECTFIADGGDIQFATSGTTFKLNGGKTLLKNGGTAVLIKENGTTNFYLKGDLT